MIADGGKKKEIKVDFSVDRWKGGQFQHWFLPLCAYKDQVVLGRLYSEY